MPPRAETGAAGLARDLVRSVNDSPDRGAFPIALVVLTLVFLVVHSRIDRSDPKLAMAARTGEDSLEFTPPGHAPVRRLRR